MQEALPPGDFHIQEERRLCYVAFTRARQRLLLSTLTGPRKKPSVFLEDILRHPTSAARIEQTEPKPDAAGKAPTIQTGQAALFGRPKDTAFHSRITEWAKDNDGLEIAEPLPLNHSALRTFKDCPLKYKLEHLWHLRGHSNPAMVFGSIMHRTLAEFFRARQKNPSLPLEELKHLYDLQWEATIWPFPDDHQREDYRASGWEQLETFYAQQAGLSVTVLDMEKNFEWKWEDVVLTGRIDQINQLAEKKVELVEYKTGKPQTEKQIEKSPQLALYALAAERELQYKPERLTLYNLTSNEPHSFSPEEKILNKVLDDIRDTAARIRARAFPATPNFFCRTCDYRTLCPAQEQNLSIGLPENEEEKISAG
jgi:RecB family exonuclease